MARGPSARNVGRPGVKLHPLESAFARTRLQLDLTAAQRIQRRFLPDALPPESGVRFEAQYLPAFSVGGDFYDLVYHGEGRVSAAIGDVCGKGVAAALLMARMSWELRRLTGPDTKPSRILAQANSFVADTKDESCFVTASFLQIDTRRRRLEAASAGHIPLVIKRRSGAVLTFGAPSGTPLGMLPCEYRDEEVELDPLDIVILMTDGLVDALDGPGDRPGIELMLELVRRAPHDPRAMNEHILTVVEKMKGSKPLDDMTLVALQVQR
jgi:phosphoserine phosphatase RsbU/P